MIPRLACEGAPRDLGLDQGRVCRRGIRAATAGLRRPGREAERSLVRHFPHFAERLEGLALGASVGRQALLARLHEEGAVAAGRAPSCEVEIVERRAALVAMLPLARDGLEGWVLRETRPEAGYRSFELTRPWLVGSYAGVNAPGLAAAWRAPAHEAAEGADDPLRAAPLLLVQQCLERFDAVEKCLEWCERRPAGGAGILLFADAAGSLGTLELAGSRALRRLAAPPEPKAGAETRCLTLRFHPSASRVEWSDERDAGGEIRL